MSVYDKAIAAYLRPYFCQTIPAGERLFRQAALDPQSPFYAHPEHYALFLVGTWDDNDCTLTSFEPEVILRAHEIERPTAEDELRKLKQMLGMALENAPGNQPILPPNGGPQ